MFKILMVLMCINNIITFGLKTAPSVDLYQGKQLQFWQLLGILDSVSELGSMGHKGIFKDGYKESSADWRLWKAIYDKNIPLAFDLLQTSNKEQINKMINTVGRKYNVRPISDKNQISVLQLALSSLNIELVTKLISHNIDVNKRNLQKGTDNHMYGNGDNPLDYVINKLKWKTGIEILLNADNIKISQPANRINGNKKTAIQLASDPMKYLITDIMCKWLNRYADAGTMLNRQKRLKRDDFVKHIPFSSLCPIVDQIISKNKHLQKDKSIPKPTNKPTENSAVKSTSKEEPKTTAAPEETNKNGTNSKSEQTDKKSDAKKKKQSGNAKWWIIGSIVVIGIGCILFGIAFWLKSSKTEQTGKTAKAKPESTSNQQ